MRPLRNALLTVTLALHLLFLSPAWCSASSPDSKPMVFVRDSIYFFSVRVPSDWKTDRATEDDSSLRISATAPDGNTFIGIYAFKRPGTVDVGKLAKIDGELFKDLGTLQKTQEIRDSLMETKAIEMTYSKNSKGIYRLARFQAYGTYGYVMVVLSKSTDFTSARPTLESFSSNVPPLTNFETMSSEVERLLGPVARRLFMLFALMGCLYLLGKTGQLVRKGVEMRKFLLKARGEAVGKGMQVNKKWYSYNRKAYSFILIPSLSWGFFYVLLFGFLPFKLFAVSLLFLLVPLLGYFGVFFVPSDDGSSYQPDGL